MGCIGSSEPPGQAWKREETKDGVTYYIAPYYFPHVVQKIESDYNKVIPLIRIDLTAKVKINRNDKKNAIEFRYNKTDAESKREFEKVDKFMSTN